MCFYPFFFSELQTYLNAVNSLQILRCTWINTHHPDETQPLFDIMVYFTVTNLSCSRRDWNDFFNTDLTFEKVSLDNFLSNILLVSITQLLTVVFWKGRSLMFTDWLIDWFKRHDSSSRVILCIDIIELRSLYAHIYIFLVFLEFFKKIFYFIFFTHDPTEYK